MSYDIAYEGMKLIIPLEEQAFDTTDKITVFINLTHQLNVTNRL